MTSSEQTTNPYAPPVPSKSLRIIKADPYDDIFSKWNFYRWAFYFTCIILVLLAVVNKNWINGVAEIVFALFLFIYYRKKLYNVRKMEETLNIWDFRKRTVLKEDLIVTVETDSEDLDEVFPLKQIILVIPGFLTLLRFKGDIFAVAWKVHTKNIDSSEVESLELRVKKWLDGLVENLVFCSIWYNVDNHNTKTIKVIGEAAESPIRSTPKDLHIQALMAHTSARKDPVNVVKHIYMMSLGHCYSIEEAIKQYDAVIPGLERILKSSIHELSRMTSVDDVIAVYQELWDSDEVEEW